jgi:hypothetical protein
VGILAEHRDFGVHQVHAAAHVEVAVLLPRGALGRDRASAAPDLDLAVELELVVGVEIEAVGRDVERLFVGGILVAVFRSGPRRIRCGVRRYEAKVLGEALPRQT